MTDLADFLLARIAEDEAVATDEAVARASAGTAVLGPAYDDHPGRDAIREQLQEAVVDVHRRRPWSSTLGPARVLAECEAKRRIVEDHGDQHDCTSLNAGDWPYVGCTTLRVLALPYADHPDYREAWRP